jgi:hypothetical protein
MKEYDLKPVDGRCSPNDASSAGSILRDDPWINLFEKWLENVTFKFINCVWSNYLGNNSVPILATQRNVCFGRISDFAATSRRGSVIFL